MHRSRPTYRFDTDCQLPAASLVFHYSLTPEADLSRQRWVSDRSADLRLLVGLSPNISLNLCWSPL